jgi:hypothetical protein
MKKIFILLTGVSLILNHAIAQSSFLGDKSVAATLAVIHAAVSNPNAIVISGKLIDAATSQPIRNAKLKFAKANEVVLNAAIDEKGNYAIALDKSAFGKSANVMLKIAGYEDFKLRKISKINDLHQVDMRLKPDEKNHPTAVRYQLNDDPYNTLVIKF